MAIEKRIRYQDGKGVHDPLEALVFLMSKRSSPGGLSPAEEKELNRLMEETGFMSQRKAQGGRIKTRTASAYLGDKYMGMQDLVDEFKQRHGYDPMHDIDQWLKFLDMKRQDPEARGIETILNLHKRSA